MLKVLWTRTFLHASEATLSGAFSILTLWPGVLGAACRYFFMLIPNDPDGFRLLLVSSLLSAFLLLL